MSRLLHISRVAFLKKTSLSIKNILGIENKIQGNDGISPYMGV
jgi:hypothetical protein